MLFPEVSRVCILEGFIWDCNFEGESDGKEKGQRKSDWGLIGI